MSLMPANNRLAVSRHTKRDANTESVDQVVVEECPKLVLAVLAGWLDAQTGAAAAAAGWLVGRGGTDEGANKFRARDERHLDQGTTKAPSVEFGQWHSWKARRQGPRGRARPCCAPGCSCKEARPSLLQWLSTARGMKRARAAGARTQREPKRRREGGDEFQR